MIISSSCNSASDFRIAAGYWSTNIGNAFFHFGFRRVLSDALPEASISFCGDTPAYWNIMRREVPQGAEWAPALVQPDVLFLMGPLLRPEFPSIWKRMMEQMRGAKTRVCLAGLGAMDYSPGVMEACREAFAANPPHAIITRDSAVFEALQGVPCQIYDGVCPAFFVSLAHPKKGVKREAYAVIGCDKTAEPVVEAARAGSSWLPIVREERLASAAKLGTLQEAIGVLRTWLPRAGPEEVGRVRIVRPTHRTNPFVLRRLFGRPGAFVYDIPEPYLDLYGHADWIVSDRLHACVAGLSYGVPARMIGHTHRARLLERMGVERAENGFMTLPPERIRQEYSAMRDWVADALQ
jgi:hypothetical protein